MDLAGNFYMEREGGKITVSVECLRYKRNEEGYLLLIGLRFPKLLSLFLPGGASVGINFYS